MYYDIFFAMKVRFIMNKSSNRAILSKYWQIHNKQNEYKNQIYVSQVGGRKVLSKNSKKEKAWCREMSTRQHSTSVLKNLGSGAAVRVKFTINRCKMIWSRLTKDKTITLNAEKSKKDRDCELWTLYEHTPLLFVRIFKDGVKKAGTCSCSPRA